MTTNTTGAHRPETTGTAPQVLGPARTRHRGGPAGTASLIRVLSWRDQAEHARAEAQARQDYRGRRSDARELGLRA